METLQSITSSSDPDNEMFDPSGEISLRNLPDDLIIEILTWLPAKTLVRFRCVSKSWLSVISTPKFIKAHLENSSNRDDCAHHRVLFRCKETIGNLRVFDYESRHCPLSPVLFGPTTTPIESCGVDEPIMMCSQSRILGVRRGLVCVAVREELYFWNPAIGKFKKLAAEIDGLANSKPWKQRMVLFDYDEVDEEYKLYLIGSEDSHSEGWIDVYSGDTDIWRRIHGFEFGDWPSRLFFVVRGKLHWGRRTDKGEEIAYFDLKSESYGVVEQPVYGKGTFDLDFQELEGNLAVCCYYRNSHVDLWIMEEYGLKESWTKVVLVPKFKDPSCKKVCIPIFMSNDGKIVFKYWKFMAISDPKHKTVMHPCVTFMEEPWQLYVFIESLVLLNDHDEVGPVCKPGSSLIEMVGYFAPVPY